MSSELCFLTIAELSKSLLRKEISPVDLVMSFLRRIESVDSTVNAFITTLADESLLQAREAEREILAGEHRGQLHGIPFAVKDLFFTRGTPTTCGTKIFQDFVPAYDSTVVSKLRQAGAILIGKLNLQQLGVGATGENPDYGNMHNPWHLDYITGGSSGGSAASMAARECSIALGTDAGGSVRIPSSLCGVVGLKATYGLFSRRGVMASAWSLDHPGPITRTVEDVALVTQAMVGHDPNDPASADVANQDYTEALVPTLKGLRIGVPKEFGQAPIDPSVDVKVNAALAKLEELGATLHEVSWPMFQDNQAIATTILLPELASQFGDLTLRRGSELTDRDLRLRIEAGRLFTATEYLKAQRARLQFRLASLRMFKTVDVVAGPTLPIAGCRRGETEVMVASTRMSILDALTQYTRAFNLNGFPAMTVPCGFTDGGLPVGLQLAAQPFAEMSLFRVGFAYQQATDWGDQHPPI